MIKKGKLFILSLLSMFIFSFIWSACTKENDKSDFQNQNIFERNEINNMTFAEPNYEYIGNSIHEYLKNKIGFVSPENFFLPNNHSLEFRTKFDSMSYIYKDNTYEEMLNSFVYNGYITTELKDYRIAIYNELKNNVSNYIEFLNEKFNQVELYNLSQDEKSILKMELISLKNIFIFADEINAMQSDTSLVFRGEPGDDCRIEPIDRINAYSKALAIGATVGSTIGGPFGTAIGSVVGLVITYILIEEQDKMIEFCKNCIPTGLSRQFIDCNHSANFLPSAGENAYKFSWSITNGTAETYVTVPGQELYITQTVPGDVLLIEVTSHCHYDEDTDLKAKKEFGLYNLYEEQKEVPYGAIFFYGIDYFKFPSPTSQNYEDYSHTETLIYGLSGEAILYPDRYTIEVVSSQNAINIILNGDKLTVTWKIDSQYWDEFYGEGNFGSTNGKVNLEVKNTCPEGESDIVTLNSVITHGHP